MRAICCVIIAVVLASLAPPTLAESGRPGTDVFDRVELLVVSGDKTERVPVRLRLDADMLLVESRKTGAVIKSFRYSDISGAEYSYSKHPRWKAGAGTAIGSAVVFPLAILALPVAIPLAFSKSKRHWLTIKTDSDYAVLKLDKRNQKAILPAFEVHSGVKVEALGESK